MILKETSDTLVSGDIFKSYYSKINKDKLSKLYKLLSGIYRNPIGSIIREYVSNAVDANTEAYDFKTKDYETLRNEYTWIREPLFNFTETSLAELKEHILIDNVKKPIIVNLSKSENTLSIQDFGIGISPERLINIFINYLDSTKETSVLAIGAYGIGGKSAFNYTDSFFINTIYNGVEYKWLIFKSNAGIPECKLLSQVETTE